MILVDQTTYDSQSYQITKIQFKTFVATFIDHSNNF